MRHLHAPGFAPIVFLGSDAEADEVQRILDARAAFITAYCRARQWSEDPDELTFEQVFEIREQEGWKNP